MGRLLKSNACQYRLKSQHLLYTYENLMRTKLFKRIFKKSHFNAFHKVKQKKILILHRKMPYLCLALSVAELN